MRFPRLPKMPLDVQAKMLPNPPRRLVGLPAVVLSVGLLAVGPIVGLTARLTSGQRPPNPAPSATPPSIVGPQAFGLAIPTGPVVKGDGQRVMTRNSAGRPVVSEVYARVGEHLVLLMPDGELVARVSDRVAPTDRKFSPEEKGKLAEQLTASSFLGFRTKTTRHYVYVYNTSDRFALVASRILESMIRGMMAHAKSQRIEVHPPRVPLVMIMFRTEQEFHEYRRMPEGVLAYYHPLSNWVVLHEESPLANIQPRLAIQQTVSTIAHEGAHQILHNIGVQARLSAWPMWLNEGLAEYYAPTSFGKKLRWMGAGKVNDLRMFELEQYLKSRDSRLPNTQLIQETVQAGRLTSAGYASAWSLTHFLATTRRADFNKYVKKASELGPFETLGGIAATGNVPENLDSFSDHFGADLEELERRWLGHLNRLPYNDPFAEGPHFVATVALPTGNGVGRDANLFHTRTLAKKWINARLATLGRQEHRNVHSKISEFPNRIMAERFVREWLRN